jgi:hypothetical protein
VDNTGIGQGSILSPNIFINDLALLILIAFLVLYADDANSILKTPTTQIPYHTARLTNTVFENWARDHLLKVLTPKRPLSYNSTGLEVSWSHHHYFI